MLLLIDNYDSFTYNLADIFARYIETKVIRNDKITIAEIEALPITKIVLSPGPGRPNSAGITLDVIKQFAGKIPILGVCLGHQSIAQAFGGVVTYAEKLMHGKTSDINVDGKSIFTGIENKMQVMRYHSLIVERATLPDCFEISATSDTDEVMAIRHREFDIEGVQFHPESIMTPAGEKLLLNFLEREVPTC